jgi:hypothetical protein
MRGVYQHYDLPELEHTHCVYDAREPYQAGWDQKSEPYYGATIKDGLPPSPRTVEQIEQATFIVHSHIHGDVPHRHVTSQELPADWCLRLPVR